MTGQTIDVKRAQMFFFARRCSASDGWLMKSLSATSSSVSFGTVGLAWFDNPYESGLDYASFGAEWHSSMKVTRLTGMRTMCHACHLYIVRAYMHHSTSSIF